MGCRTKNRIGFYNNLCKMLPHNTTNVYHLYCTVMEKDTSSTDLEEVNTSDERSTDISIWSNKKRKKLQHMTEFHQEYQRIFGDKASLRTIIKKRISHMNPPIPTTVCQEEMQNAKTDDIIIEYITDSKGNRVKKLKPLFIKSEPNKTYVQHLPSDEELPPVPEENFHQTREITLDSYSESISSDDELSDDATITADSDSSGAQDFEDTPPTVDTKVTDIEATLQQIASGLQNAANGYLALASQLPHLSPYELPQTIAQIPPPPINVPIAIRKALTIDGERKTIHHLIRGDYELNHLSFTHLQHKYAVSRDTVYTAIKGKRRPGGSQYRRKKKRKPDVASTSKLI